MKQDWTKEPWEIYYPTKIQRKCLTKVITDKDITITEKGGFLTQGFIAIVNSEYSANANRIVACVNACAGLSNEDLKLASGGKTIAIYNRIEKGE